GRGAAAEEIRLDVTDARGLDVFAVGHRSLHAPAGPHQVALAHAHFGDQPVDRGIAAGNREVAGELLLHVDVEDDAVGGRARLLGDLDALEVIQVLQAPLGAIDQHLVEGVALGDLELAPDHVLAGARVAANV